MKEKALFYWDVFKRTFKAYNNSNVFIEAAGLAYSAIFSIPGLLIIIIWLLGAFFGEEVVRGEISRQVEIALDRKAAKSIEDIVEGAMIDKRNFWMKAIGVLALIFGATTMFFMLQKALNNLWGINPKPKQALMKYLTDRANSLGLIIVIGFLMTITMVTSSIVSVLNHYITQQFGLETYALAQIINFVVGFFVVMGIFAVIFKILPDVEIPWKAVYTGAFVTAILFTLGKFLLSYYFAEFEPTSAYGTAGTLVLIMMWINYSFLIIFFGAEFTKINALKKGFRFSPSSHAEWKDPETKELVNELKPEKVVS